MSAVVLQYMLHALYVTGPLCFPLIRGRNHNGYMSLCSLSIVHNPARVRFCLKSGPGKAELSTEQLPLASMSLLRLRHNFKLNQQRRRQLSTMSRTETST